MLSAGFKTYQYDQAGRTTRIGSQVLTYDDEDRLVSYGGRTNVYNGFDTRVSSSVGAVNYSYHRDGSGVTAPLLSDSIQTFTPGISSRMSGVTTYPHGGLKDVSAISNSNRSITGSRVYDAYGATLSTTGSWQAPFGYGGQYGYQEDGNGLQLLGHRYYDPSTGRFLTRDPIKDGRNWYSYCDNNPVNAIDADGLARVIIRTTSKGVGHSWILIEFDDGTVWVMENNTNGGVRIYKPGDKGYREKLNRSYDAARVKHFDQKRIGGKSGITDLVASCDQKWNLFTNNCCEFSGTIWYALTGEYLGDSPTPGNWLLAIEALNANDDAKFIPRARGPRVNGVIPSKRGEPSWPPQYYPGQYALPGV